MADLVIRGMEMPIDCHSCWMRVYCFERGIGIWGCGKGNPCPLVPLPEGHGRLGDLEAAEAILHNKAFDLAGTSAEYNALNWALRQIKALPTIIEADLEWKMKNCCCFSNTDQAEGGTDNGT